MKSRRIPVILTIIVFAIIAVSCGKKGVPPDENDKPHITLELISGNDQSAMPSRYLPDTLLVRVMSSIGTPVVNDSVRFVQVTQMDGGLFWLRDTANPVVGLAMTDDNGFAWNRYQTDTLVGSDTIEVTASSLGDSGAVYFEVTVVPGLPADIVKISPPPPVTQSGPAGELLPDSSVVQVSDRYGNLVPSSKVVFKTNQRCLVVTDSSVHQQYETDTAYTFTGTDGVAWARWILTINPDPNLGFPYGYPNGLPELWVYAYADTARVDSVLFRAFATNPGQLAYYHDIRPILIENCQSAACHPNISEYRLDFYYELRKNDNMIPGDTSTPFVENLNPIMHKGGDINFVEEDKGARWVVVDNAFPGSSGLNNYTDQMKAIIDNGCISCHGGASPVNDYDMTTHPGIRGGGSDTVANAIAGDSASLLVTQMIARHNADSLSLDPGTAAALADSLIRWVVTDSLRQY